MGDCRHSSDAGCESIVARLGRSLKSGLVAIAAASSSRRCMPWGTSAEATEPARTGGKVDPSDSDLNLIRSFRAGDEAAFDRLFGKHQDYVYNVCLGILGNPDDARDCAQEAFLRVYRKVGEYPPGHYGYRSFVPWPKDMEFLEDS